MAPKANIVHQLVLVTAVRCTALMFKEMVGDHPLACHHVATINATWIAFTTLFDAATDQYHTGLKQGSLWPVPRPRLWVYPADPIAKWSSEDQVDIGPDHYLEILDRVSCVNNLFDTLVVKHGLAETLQSQIDRVAELLADLYQEAGSDRRSHGQ